MIDKRPSTLLALLCRRLDTAGSDESVDRQLLERFSSQHDEAAFATLVRRHGSLVLGTCRNLLHNAHDAEDAFQATFLVLAHKAGSVRWQRSIGSWLYVVACRVARKMKAQSARRRAREEQVANMSKPEPLTEAARRELHEAVHNELGRLPEKYRAPVILCDLQGKTSETAARELGWPIGSMSKRLARARELLRERLTQRGLVVPAGLLPGLLADTATAAVPETLEVVLARGIACFTAGQQAVAGGVSQRAVDLSRSVLHGMLIGKLKMGLGVGLLVALIGLGAGALGYLQRADRQTGAALTEGEATQSSGAVAPKPAEQSGPLAVSLRDLGLGADSVGALAVSADGQRVYVGKQNSHDPARQNLVAIPADRSGRLAGDPRRYRDTESALPAKTHATVSAILPDTGYRKLYLGHYLTGPKLPEGVRSLTVYDLDAKGDPVGPPRSYSSGNAHPSLQALARHPRLNLLYMAGWGSPAVFVSRLDDKGEPQGEPRAFAVGSHGKVQITISPRGDRLYLGTHPDTLEIVDLDDQGMPVGKARRFVAGKEEVYLRRFQCTPQALYLVRATEDGPRLGIWRLDKDGNPAGPVHVRPDVTLTALVVDAGRGELWIAAPSLFTDAFSRKRIVDGTATEVLTLRSDGDVTAPGKRQGAQFRQNGIALALAPGSAPVLLTQPLPDGVLGNRMRGYRVRATILEARLGSGKEAGAEPATLTLFDKVLPLGDLGPGRSSAWSELDRNLQDQKGPLLARVALGPPSADPFAPATVAHLRLRIEVAQGDPDAGGKVLKTLTDTVRGNTVLFLLPGYAHEPPEDPLDAIELFSDHYRRYLRLARAAALKPEERPR
jgi:RNA polymerase sigma factor (sigma-70 family)